MISDYIQVIVSRPNPNLNYNLVNSYTTHVIGKRKNNKGKSDKRSK